MNRNEFVYELEIVKELAHNTLKDDSLELALLPQQTINQYIYLYHNYYYLCEHTRGYIGT